MVGDAHPTRQQTNGPTDKNKKPGTVTGSGFEKFFGGDLLSHTASRAVPSALKGLTSVFGMGTGVSPSPLPPKT
jgi:hypothetical protein